MKKHQQQQLEADDNNGKETPPTKWRHKQRQLDADD